MNAANIFASCFWFLLLGMWVSKCVNWRLDGRIDYFTPNWSKLFWFGCWVVASGLLFGALWFVW